MLLMLRTFFHTNLILWSQLSNKSLSMLSISFLPSILWSFLMAVMSVMLHQQRLIHTSVKSHFDR
uniref:Uncharacterized protein n=1 Tax=Amphimedon queenslandica TaxID=400682 RepID=A0A1X7UC47_AMPQE